MPRLMYFDCFSGAAGDMVLGALLDAGLPADVLRQALGSLGVGHELVVSRVMRAGLSATHVAVVPAGAGAHDDRSPAHDHTHDEAHSHDHAHPHRHNDGHDRGPGHAHADLHDHGHRHEPGASPSGHRLVDDEHRSVAEIVRLIDSSALSVAGKARAAGMIRRLAEAEAAIHDMPVSDVHLHEVGAIDSIIDIVGAVCAMDWFGIEDVVASPLNVGGGTVHMAHGTYPVPAPATLRLLAGLPVYSGGRDGELVTPTGALVISTYARAFGPLPAMRVDRVGYGAGTRNPADRPNVLRVVIGERDLDGRAVADEAVVQIECEIDDMNPQLFGPATEALLSAGALDVFLTPVQMKKNRPGTLVTVLGRAADRVKLSDVLFRETTTIGVRFTGVERETMEREWVEMGLEGGTVRIKVGRRRGEVLSAGPEFDDCVRVARATGRSVKAIQAEALKAWFAHVDAPAAGAR